MTALLAVHVSPENRRDTSSATARALQPSEPASDGLSGPTSGVAPSLAQPTCTEAASPYLRDSQATDDADSSRAAQLIRQSSMAVHPSTTRDVCPEADPELLLDDPDALDDWTPVRSHGAAPPGSDGGLRLPVSQHGGLLGTNSLSQPLATGSAMHSRAVAARLHKEAR